MQKPTRYLYYAFKALGFLVAAYIIIYAFNSALGGYWMMVTWEPMKSGIDAPDRIQRTAGIRWQPRFGYADPYQTNDFLGCFFAPLIAIDQQWIHRTRFVSNPDFGPWSQNLPVNELHPKHRHFYLPQPSAPHQ